MRNNLVLYISSGDYPNQTANSVQQIKTAHAIARHGVKVQFLAKNSRRHALISEENVYAHYGLTPHPYFEFHPVEVPGGRQRYRIFLAKALLRCARLSFRQSGMVIWTREPALVIATKAVLLNRTVTAFEAHDLADVHGRGLPARMRVLYRLAIRASDWIVTVTQRAKSVMIDLGVPAERIIVVPDAAEPSNCSPPRQRLDPPVRIVYAGSLHPDRGCETLIRCMAFLPPQRSIHLIVVGGLPDQVRKLQELANITKVGHMISFTGYVPHAKVEEYLCQADILAQPMGRSVVADNYASPMKLFEYMSTGRPIIACNVRTIREVVDEKTVYFCEPDDPESLALTIIKVIKEWDKAVRMGSRARELLLSEYTFEKRACKIVQAIGLTCKG